ncbi:MBL fold metallo-hydrolase [Cetobacterium sp. 8H]|uniref:MBL fold metallo-hydrolase n=1 Tax=Cetobacterium sp. 8H TaxID=2759681 RepID=UPI00163C2591|nr:MBL fold metallo-hydrolase [Cetobacterium sp. 8H]MBC2851632.1 MBL fold metallo-hydrolase [Cetobacterium sp. 8H]
MKIKTFPLGGYMTNCYLVWNEKNEASLFDCSDSRLQGVVSFIKEHNLELKNVILTHGHGDHIGGINEIMRLFPNATLYIGKEEEKFLTDASLNLSYAIQGYDFIYTGKFTPIKEGDSIFGFEVVDTPGHTIGSKCFYNSDAKIMISGDTLFRRSYGRFDLPTGNLSQLQRSLKKICENYPEDTIVYSGHSEPTTLGEERRVLKSQGMF